ncbi:MAG: hypothetical protein Kow0032_06850 [Methyloligellaceae bacterium]
MAPTRRKKKRNRFTRALRGAMALLLLVGGGLFAVSPVPALHGWVEEAGEKIATLEKRMRRRLGLPLRGTPDLTRLPQRLAEKGLAAGNPVFIRIFKRESELEMWMQKEGRFIHFATYPVCRWSGRLGPKLKEGDRQSPEGFYTVERRQLNPNSRWHRSFNLGFPNVYDRAHGRTGSFLMVHGGCGSIGCYAMTNPVIDEIWRLVTAALDGGQRRFHVHVYPFRMTALNMALHGSGRWHGFWQQLKQGHDLFEETRLVPRISVCAGRYSVQAATDARDSARPVSRSCGVNLTRR